MKNVNPWELITDKTVSQLVFAYEMVLTEMRKYTSNRGIREWVVRLDSERDDFVDAMTRRAAEPTCSHSAPPPNARWCSKCGALYDGSEWLYPSSAPNRPAEGA